MYDRLKTEILRKAGLTRISPGDCKNLSEDIYRSLRKTISTTTLKRFFGFASLNFHFSKYTLDTLAEYASDNDGMNDFDDIAADLVLNGNTIRHVVFTLDDGTELNCHYLEEAPFVKFEYIKASNDKASFTLHKRQIGALLSVFMKESL